MKKILFLLFALISLASFGQVPDTSRAKKVYGNMLWVKYDTTAATWDTLGIFPGIGNGIWATEPIHLFSENDTVLNVEGVSVLKDAYVNLYGTYWIVKDYTTNEQLTWGAHFQRGINISSPTKMYEISPGYLKERSIVNNSITAYGDTIELSRNGAFALLCYDRLNMNTLSGFNIYDGAGADLVMSISTDSAISMTGSLSVDGELSGGTLYTGDAEINGNLVINGLYYQSDSTNLVNGDSIVFTDGISGWGEVYAFNAGAIDEWAEFIISSDGAVYLKSNSTDVANTDTDNKLCIFDNGTGVTIRNRLGGTRTIKYIIHH